MIDVSVFSLLFKVKKMFKKIIDFIICICRKSLGICFCLYYNTYITMVSELDRLNWDKNWTNKIEFSSKNVTA